MSIAAYGRIAHSKLTLTSSNNVIIFNDGTSDRTATITAGDYFIRGDDNATSGQADLLKAVKDALNNAPSSTITDFTVTQNTTTGAAALGKITIANDSASNFTLKWTDGSTTFDGAELGFATGADDSGAATYTSDNQAKGLWFPEREGDFLDNNPWRRNTSSEAISGAKQTINLSSGSFLSVLYEGIPRTRVKTTYASTNVALQENAFAYMVDGGDFLVWPDNSDSATVYRMVLRNLGGRIDLHSIAVPSRQYAPEAYDVTLDCIEYAAAV